MSHYHPRPLREESVNFSLLPLLEIKDFGPPSRGGQNLKIHCNRKLTMPPQGEREEKPSSIYPFNFSTKLSLHSSPFTYLKDWIALPPFVREVIQSAGHTCPTKLKS